MNLHQHEIIVAAKGKHLSITIQNCDPIREAVFRKHVGTIEALINSSDGFSITDKSSDKKREATRHISILDSFKPE